MAIGYGAVMSNSNLPSLDEARAYIDSIDFSMVINKIVKTKGWKKADVLKICEYYKHFLFLNKKYSGENEALPPSLEIDEFWHTHILDTKKYHKDCEKIFGHYMHHYPYFGIDGETTTRDLDNAFEKTQELHYKEYGDYIYNIRHVFLNQMKTITQQLLRELKSKKAHNN